MMLQLCQVTSALFISNSRSACSETLLQQHRITLLINVTKQQPFPVATATGRLPVATATLRVPVYDRPDQDLYAHFDPVADAIRDEAALHGGRSLVYCKNGRSRSAAVCIAFLMKHRDMTMRDALKKVKTARNEIDPNSGFREQLQRYELELERRRGRHLKNTSTRT